MPYRWLKKVVVVTGGSGFLGRNVVRQLQEAGASVYIPRSSDVNLMKQGELERYIRQLPEKDGAEVLVHLAGTVGGIGSVSKNPYMFMYNNLVMGANSINDAIVSGVQSIIYSNSVCAYPKETSVPTDEGQYWDGYPEETNAPYGLAKKVIGELLFAAREQYGLEVANLVMANMYGPGDNFDPTSSHVIPALIRSMYNAKRAGARSVTFWGTGKPTRDFLYVSDAARAIRYSLGIDLDTHINVASGVETSIWALSKMVSACVGYSGEVLFDSTHPDGQPRRKFDNSKFVGLTSWSPQITIMDGIENTVRWYVDNLA